MKEQTEKIFRAIGDVGDDLIERADRPVRKHAQVWVKWAALAACCALVIGAAALASDTVQALSEVLARMEEMEQEGEIGHFFGHLGEQERLELIRQLLPPETVQMQVTPVLVDQMVENFGKILAEGIQRAVEKTE